jgi:hypothetical protein
MVVPTLLVEAFIRAQKNPAVVKTAGPSLGRKTPKEGCHIGTMTMRPEVTLSAKLALIFLLAAKL